MPGPLDGVRVIDLTTMVSGPLGAMILADQGADVIKVEVPGIGDHSRHVATRRGGFSASFLNNNRNKRSIALDLKHADGLAALKRLIAGADVVLQNFRPGVVERLGLGYDDARVIRPGIIYASITGFGDTGPYAGKPVFDPLIQSLSGLTTVQAGSDQRRPALVRTILPDKLTGFTIAQAISAALFARERNGPNQGQGQHIRLSMLDTVIAFLWSSDMGGNTFVGDEVEAETAQSFIDLIYETADGYISVAAFRRADWVKLAQACERPEWIDDPRFLTSEGLEVHKPERLELTAGPDPARDDQPPPGGRERHHRRDRPPPGWPPAPEPHPGTVRRHARRASQGWPGAGRQHPRGSGRGRVFGQRDRRPDRRRGGGGT
jgi:crotonobetainyl-CoA:carnitine CoA-transferase CaiB-like acyl-CoA transferase